MHNANKTERCISIPSLMVRNCTVTPTAMGAALQFIRALVRRLARGMVN
jgi:hypothetical protein